jgi:NitT/TauT family transport system ATP-binding protein
METGLREEGNMGEALAKSEGALSSSSSLGSSSSSSLGSSSSYRVLCENLSLSYGKERALEDLSFSLRAGRSLSVVGGSGRGKTSLLKAIYGLIPDKITKGRVVISPYDAKKAFVMQDYGLFPWKTAERNIELPLLLSGVSKRERRRITEPLIEELGLGRLKDRYPHELSGGERQRTALGRALGAGADLILLDEPFSSLDAITRERLEESVSELFIKRGLSSILATHSIEEAVFLGDQVLVLGKRPARVVRTFENPGRRGRDFRFEESFFNLVSEVRKTLQETEEGEAEGWEEREGEGEEMGGEGEGERGGEMGREGERGGGREGKVRRRERALLRATKTKEKQKRS